MTDRSERGHRSVPRRVVAFFDPAEEGFVRRMALSVGVVAAAILCASCGAAARFGASSAGRYWVGVALLEAGRPAYSERIARDLVAEADPPAYGHYRLLAAALRRQGDHEGQSAVFDAAVTVFPDVDAAHGHRCWYGALNGRAAAVMDSCDRAVDLADRRAAGSTRFWRAAARALTGDTPGAVADLEDARSAWDDGAASPRQYRRAAARWLEALRAGHNPLDEAETDRLRGWF